MSHLQDQIKIEQQRIAVFEAKIAHCKKRIESLEFLIRDSDDEMDTLASSAVIVSQQKPSGSAGVTGGSRKRPINEKSKKLLQYIGKEGKATKQLVAFSDEQKLELSDQNIRNFAMIFRKRYGLLESPHPGFYRLTEAGQNAIK